MRGECDFIAFAKGTITVLQALCPLCRQGLLIPPEMAGRAMRCPHCGGAFQAPPAVAMAQVTQPAAPAPGFLPNEVPATSAGNWSPSRSTPAGSSPTRSVPAQDKPSPAPARKQKSAMIEALKIVAGGAVGVALGWVIIVKVIFPMQQRQAEPTVVVQKNERRPEPLAVSPQQPLPAGVPPVMPPSSAETKPPPSLPPTSLPPGAFSPAPLNPPIVPPNSSPPSSTPAPTPPADPDPPPTAGNPFAGLPIALKMPSPVATAAQPVATFARGLTEQLEIVLDHALADLAETAAFVALRAENSATIWHVHYFANRQDESAPKRKLGQFELADRDLRYVWDQVDDETPWKQLANCQIELTSGEYRHVAQLREPKRAEPLVLDLDKAKDVHKIAVGTPPKPEHVHLSLERLTGFPSGADIKGDKRLLAPSQEAVIEFASLPGAAVEVKFTRQVDETFSVIVSPVFKEKGSDDIPMTNQRLQDIAEAADKWLREASVAIPQLEREFRSLRDQLQSAQSQASGTSGAAYVAATRNVNAISNRLDACGRKLKRMNQQVPEMKARQAAVPAIKSLMDSLHTKAKLELKIVASKPDGSALALIELR